MSAKRYVPGVHLISPKTAPASVVARMPISIAARTPHAASPQTTISPNSASSVFLSFNLPSVTNVAGLGTIIPALRSPIMAMNKPMPAATAA